MKGLSHLSSVRHINDESIRKRKKYEEDLKLKKKILRDEFNNFEQNGINSLVFTASSNEIKVILLIVFKIQYSFYDKIF